MLLSRRVFQTGLAAAALVPRLPQVVAAASSEGVVPKPVLHGFRVKYLRIGRTVLTWVHLVKIADPTVDVHYGFSIAADPSGQGAVVNKLGLSSAALSHNSRLQIRLSEKPDFSKGPLYLCFYIDQSQVPVKTFAMRG